LGWDNAVAFTGNVHGGQFTTGAYTGYAWPAAGNYGTYLGPSGLLIGNLNNNNYLQVTQDGNIYTPGFNVVNGTMTVNQANVINTLNIAGNAVTIPRSASSGARVGSMYANVLCASFLLDAGGMPIWIHAEGLIHPGADETGYSTGTLRLYVDGVLVGTSSGPSTISGGHTVTALVSGGASRTIGLYFYCSPVGTGSTPASLTSARLFALGVRR